MESIYPPRAWPDRKALQTHQPIEQHRILQPAAIILLEEIAQDAAASLFIGIDANEHRPLVRGADRGFGQQAADGIGLFLLAVPNRIPDLFLTGMIGTDGENHELFQRHAILGVVRAPCFVNSSKWRHLTEAHHTRKPRARGARHCPKSTGIPRSFPECRAR